jgi:hypothetical protein
MVPKITIHGPKTDGGFAVEFCDQYGNSIVFRTGPEAEAILRCFHERIPYGVEIPDVSDVEFLPIEERRKS